ncbi:MAG: dodecin family protein [Methanopyri archaeon]|jgi:hypothetical protein|nr:dodecin family protein [Methanopyri archaeon]|tara:strand:- start:225 stop:425 length:201 start_codon:yes stop_codon:yes gene_type:complete
MVYKVIELIGTSEEGFSEAVRNALSDAEKSLHGIEYMDIGNARARVKDNKIVQYEVTVKVSFKVEK